MALRIRTDGSENTIKPDDGETFSLKELQGYVGGYIQAIFLPSGQDLLCNEEGKGLGLEVNERATLLGAAAGTMPGDQIVGDVVVLSQSEWD